MVLILCRNDPEWPPITCLSLLKSHIMCYFTHTMTYKGCYFGGDEFVLQFEIHNTLFLFVGDAFRDSSSISVNMLTTLFTCCSICVPHKNYLHLGWLNFQSTGSEILFVIWVTSANTDFLLLLLMRGSLSDLPSVSCVGCHISIQQAWLLIRISCHFQSQTLDWGPHWKLTSLIGWDMLQCLSSNLENNQERL